MAALSSNSLAEFLLLLVAISSYLNSSSAARVTTKSSTEFIRTSCSTATYPRLCYTSLSIHSSTIQTSPKLLANAALNVTLSSAKSTSTTISTLSQTHGMKPREVSAMKDCVEELSDAVNELGKSMDEMSHARQSNFQSMIDDVQTWVSAALTDENTCSDGFAGNAMNGNLKTSVRGRIVNIARLTSNALALINYYASDPEMLG
ncbi:PREDICTED: 21 kDa protein-like [Populus euphratica]|uniref:21 kDa protein-like n=1 Tax=Populus euphratica TaxID=75702 RepID=A0AAJ6V685_POPEU|nr:PREDICTED: 21 kDa protein-like [Populus euphratica]